MNTLPLCCSCHIRSCSAADSWPRIWLSLLYCLDQCNTVTSRSKRSRTQGMSLHPELKSGLAEKGPLRGSATSENALKRTDTDRPWVDVKWGGPVFRCVDRNHMHRDRLVLNVFLLYIFNACVIINVFNPSCWLFFTSWPASGKRKKARAYNKKILYSIWN